MKMNIAFCIFLIGFVGGCSKRLDHFDRPPTITAPGSVEALDVAPPSPERIALVPIEPLARNLSGAASLWFAGGVSIFSDRRANRVGDILTVFVEIDEEAEISNRTARTRQGNDEISVSAMFGLPSVADVLLPGSGTLTPAVATSGSQSSQGSGTVSREEQVMFRLAATVERVLPNGHLFIRGNQEIRINFELRDIEVSGIVRPEDVSRRNEIGYDRIADARIVYGGRGQISDMQQPRYGQRIIDIVSPF